MAAYTIPDVKLVDADGAAVPLRSELADQDRPVILNFIFTSCTAICPVMSATFSQVQAALGPEREAVRMVSISIDPEQDTPAALKAYAGKFGARPQWQMLTGSLDDSIAVQRAFDVYRGDKMNHQPATFLRAGAGQALGAAGRLRQRGRHPARVPPAACELSRPWGASRCERCGAPWPACACCWRRTGRWRSRPAAGSASPSTATACLRRASRCAPPCRKAWH